MHLEAWDSVFVRTTRRDVHDVVRDPARWGQWWPGVVAAPVRGDVVRVQFAGRARWSRHRVSARVTKDRVALGVDLTYAGDLRGAAEWYYVDEPGGTVVNYLLRAAADERSWRRLLADHRAAVRRGLIELKLRLERGRIPGAEPDTALLAAQRVAAAEFRAGVDAHARLLADAAARAEAVPEP